MGENIQDMTEKRHERIRFMKKMLRPLPRRSNLHRYPIFKWFAPAARKRDYLWSMHKSEVIRAIWIGWIIALIPMYGLQMITAFAICFMFRANCIIAMLLQWITNPFTIVPILIAQYYFGDTIISMLFGTAKVSDTIIDELRKEEVWTAISNMASGGNALQIVVATLFGGFIFAMIGASINVFFYKRYIAKHSIR